MLHMKNHCENCQKTTEVGNKLSKCCQLRNRLLKGSCFNTDTNFMNIISFTVIYEASK